MNKEENFLNIITNTISNSEFIGDDCAYLEEFNLAVSMDTLTENVHFKLDTISPYLLGKKAVLVNISDILSSGAKPKYLTVSLSGSLDEKFIKNFYKGADEICNKFNIKIIGGDLTGGEKIAISITILGDTKNRNISSRKNAKKDYIVLLKGEHGSSALGLNLLLNNSLLKNKVKYEKFKNVNYDFYNEKEKYFIKKHIEPELFPEISNYISLNCKEPYAMMDTSDGLFDALKKISDASKKGFKIEYEKITKKVDDFNMVMFGGEDYGLLICVSKQDYEKIKCLNIPQIGIVTENQEILIYNKKIKKDLRFEHF